MRLLSAALILMLAAPAGADSRIDLIDHMFGASNTNAVGGHGRLTIGVSVDGDLTVLSWPGPSLRDQLGYLSSNALDARTLPRNGAHEAMGSFVGLLVTTTGQPQLTWLRDPEWSREQGYSGPWAPIPVTRFRRDDLGLRVELIDVVSPGVDVLTRRLVLTRDPGSPVTAIALVAYENLSTSMSRIPELPIGDWAIDTINDYLAVWDANAGAILHVHPGDRAQLQNFFELINLDADVDFGAAEALMDSAAPDPADVAALVSALDAGVPGVAALVTTEPAPAGYQVGSDDTPLCALVDDLLDNLLALPSIYEGAAIPLDSTTADALRCSDQLARLRAEHGWRWQPESALADAADGSLSGSMIAAAQTNGALIAPLSFTGDVAEGSVLFAFGATPSVAREALASARALTPAERQAEAEAAAEAALSELALPDPALGERVVAVARRALVNLYVARDRATGAIVASVTRQPPYYLDWPRDGAFFTAGLDVAGRLDWASQRLGWYAGIIRTSYTEGTPVFTPNVPIDPATGVQTFPRYAWEMNYYADGTLGGQIRFEIDNTALHLWSIAAHAAHLPEAERASLLDEVWPSARQAADTIARWRDPDTGLPAPANEDDHLELTSTLHGAVSVYAGLVAAARLARAAGEPEIGLPWLDRAAELREAILAYYYDPDAGLFRSKRGGEAGPQQGSSAWLVWPARLLEPDDPRLEAQLVADMQQVQTVLSGATGGGQYTAKNILSAALYGRDDGARAMAVEALQTLADIATADTHHFGECYIAVDDPGGLTWSNRVAPPHVWEGILFYLAAMALTDPAPFDADLTALPLPEPADSGCGCGTGGPATGALPVLVVVLGLARSRRAAATRRARSRPGSPHPQARNATTAETVRVALRAPLSPTTLAADCAPMRRPR